MGPEALNATFIIKLRILTNLCQLMFCAFAVKCQRLEMHLGPFKTVDLTFKSFSIRRSAASELKKGLWLILSARLLQFLRRVCGFR